MIPVVFYDPACPAPYSVRQLRESALGGTEATVTRIAEALDAVVIQHNRRQPEGRYLPPTPMPEAEHLVVLRDPRAIPAARRLCPQARVHLWVHDLIAPGSKRGRRLAAAAALLRDLDATIICVSDFQRHGVQATLRRRLGPGLVRTKTIYNPIDDELAPDGSPVDPCKLVFFSSPNKGLAFTLDVFRAVRRRMPDMRLLVANPGYKHWRPVSIDGVEWLGPLPHERVLAHVRTALCTFCLNFVIPETFGLVFAESKALGTPVLAHACGAADEVLADVRQTLPVTAAHRAYEATAGLLPPRLRGVPARIADRLGLFEQHVERIRAWRSGERPSTGPDPRFFRSTVVGQWRELLRT